MNQRFQWEFSEMSHIKCTCSVRANGSKVITRISNAGVWHWLCSLLCCPLVYSLPAPFVLLSSLFLSLCIHTWLITASLVLCQVGPSVVGRGAQHSHARCQGRTGRAALSKDKKPVLLSPQADTAALSHAAAYNPGAFWGSQGSLKWTSEDKCPL